MKLHLGCGKKYLHGYMHVDVMPYDHIDYVSDIKDLSFAKDNSVEEIYACHVLEHIDRNEIGTTLQEFYRILVPQKNAEGKGGILRIAVPDFEAIVEEYHSNGDLELVLGLLYGGQDYEYNYHYQAYDFMRIEKLLKEAGFRTVSKYEWKDFLPEGYDDFSRAYLPHMDFENGRLMSLNIIAEK